jgi:hypothetical protein
MADWIDLSDDPPTVIFTWDWPNVRKDIQVMNSTGVVFDPLLQAALPEKERAAVRVVAYREVERIVQ